jgi:two-component system NtrC family sensor kinase
MRIFEVGDSRKLGIINPIYNEPGCWQADCHAHDEAQTVLGVLDVTLPMDEIDARISENQVQLVLFAIIAIISISFIIWLLLHFLIGKPVHQLVTATNALATGDLNYQIPVSTSDELGNLARSFNDMTNRLSNAQKQIHQSEKLASVGKLAAGVAHEINNPLTGVLTYSSFLSKRIRGGEIHVNPNQEQVVEDLDVIVHETKRCREIVKGLLDFSRQVPAQKCDVSLNEVIQQTLSILHNELQLHNIEVILDLDQDLPVLFADYNQLEQVLINIIVNASDAIDENEGKINITTRKGDCDGKPCVVVTIADNGHGISREDMTKIFDPFYSTKGRKGTGLGLAVVWGIVEKHKGKVDVHSEQGKGTTFTLTFPIRKKSTTLIREKEQ